MAVGLGPGNIVLNGNPTPLPQKGAEPPIFGPFLLWPNGWMHEDATWYEVGLSPGDCVRWGPSFYLPKKGAEPPNFWPVSIVVIWLDGSRCHLVRR